MKVYKVMMSLRMSLTVPLLFLNFISGVGAQGGWSVIYRPESICALKGSTVTMDCTYSYPEGHTVKSAFWTKSLYPAPGVEPPDLLDDPEYRDRVQYLGDKQHDCRLSLRDVRESDQSKYYFRFITDKEGGKYTGTDGVSLSVTGLQVEGPERVMEGDYIILTCKTTCRLTDRPLFTWYINGAPLYYSTDPLHLQSFSREDAGRYSCAVLDQNLHSPEVTLNIRYPPKSVSVSISPSGKIVEGSSVTLTCSSDGNPPVQKYTWFKKVDKDVQQKWTGQIYSITNIRSADSGEYQCMATNTQGSQSSEYKSLTVLHPPKSVLVFISPTGEIVEGSSVTLICISDGNPPVEYTWFKKTDTGFLNKWTGQIYSIPNIRSADSGEYQCMATNTQGSQYSEYKSLTVLYPPKSISVSISPSGEIVEGSSVNLTCSSDGNPPVQNYTWFKEGGGSSPVGSGNRYTAVESGSYYCVAQNKYGSQTAAAVPVTLGGVQSSVVFAAVGVSAACLLVVGVIFFVRRKRSGNSPDGADPRQNTDPNAQDDTYTALNPMTRSSNDVYDTLNANADSNAQNDTYTALNPKSRSSDEEYETLATVHSSPSDDA